ncbi:MULTISPECIES: PAQR family membrane homeostasis protein TrhA [unclassified Carboxylicivirga]|uniref:PAQR family membrane homeostasis protein TrhA n=1 Tax=Carboxylicivirga TaxID=1628153 RepID=UPI003D355AAA
MQINTYTPSEERLNISSHLAGFLLGVVALFFLLFKAKDLETFIAYLVYGICIISLFGASTLYHAEKDMVRRHRLKVFDHCAIYLMIAGSYVPFLSIGVGTNWAYLLLGGVWLLAIAGVILKLFFTGRFKLVSTISYVLLGWVVVIAIKPLSEQLPGGALLWLGVGGLFYTVGAILYQIKQIPYNHAIFHFFVLAGAYAHFHGIYWHL